MPKLFLDASGLNQYTKALQNGKLVVGQAIDASVSKYATKASYAETASATGLIGIIPLQNLPICCHYLQVSRENSTEEERRQYIKNTFKCIADCDMCGLCTIFHGKDPEVAYADYISGKRDYLDVSKDYR